VSLVKYESVTRPLREQPTAQCRESAYRAVHTVKMYIQRDNSKHDTRGRLKVPL
jgi:hypothetical protein